MAADLHIAEWLSGLRPGRHQRRVHCTDHRAHIEVRGLGRGELAESGRTDPDADERHSAETQRAEALRSALQTAIGAADGVEWVELNAALGFVVVAVDHPSDRLAALIAGVDSAEEEAGLAACPLPVDPPPHPADTTPSQWITVTMGADVVALGAAVLGRLARAPRLPPEVAALVPLIQSQPALRSRIEGVFGRLPVHVGLSLFHAAALGLAQGPLGLVGDIAQRATLLGETTARRAGWLRVEPEWCGAPEQVATGAIPWVERSEPAPPGPVDLYVGRAGWASLVGFAATVLATRNLRRASAVMMAGMPRPAEVGREVFAAHLGRALAERGVVVLQPDALRRLDRVDCVLLDGPAVRTGRSVIEHFEIVDDTDDTDDADGTDDAEISRWLHRLFDPARPRRVRRREGWALGRLATVVEEIGDELRDRAARLDATEVLALARDGRVVALAGVEPELDPAVGALVQIAKDAGHMVAVADRDQRLADRLGADLRVDGGAALTASMSTLQGDDCRVLLIAEPDARADAVRLADCSVGIRRGDVVPWASDLIVDDALTAAFVVAASGTAHQVSRQSVALALGASGVAGTLAGLLPLPVASRRALATIAIASLLAQANSLRAAVMLNRLAIEAAGAGIPWHELDRDVVLERLDTSSDGLSAVDAEARRDPASTADRRPSLARAVLAELSNPLTPVLAAAAGVSGAVGSATDAAIVGSVAALNGLVGGVQRFRVERSVRALEDRTEHTVQVRRDGAWQDVPHREVVVGDVISLRAGDAVPADARILEAAGLEVDESSLTGESLPVAKDPRPSPTPIVAERRSMLYAGSSVAAGSVDAVVVATGEDTEAGASLGHAGEGHTPDGVEARLRHLLRLTVPFSIGGGLGVLGLGWLRGTPLVEGLAASVNLAVAAVPEGLPLLVTMAQLSSARRLAGRGALVKNPRAIEALGRVDVICADKTGTLTEGRIELQSVWVDGRLADLADLDESAAAPVILGLRASPSGDEQELTHATDRAIVTGAAEAGIDVEADDDGWTRRAELPFEPARSFHAVLGRVRDGDDTLVVKGAPEVLLPLCTEIGTGQTRRPLDDEGHRHVTAEVEDLAGRGFRVLAVADRPASNVADLDDDIVVDLRLVGLLAFGDSVRPEAAASIEQLARAGVRVVMLTGDHPSTAQGIAEELGLLNGETVLSGPELDELEDPALDQALEHTQVFARVTPAHKVRLVEAYRRTGRVVAMTGDGANDAPAILMADVGVALGENSTTAARSAADLVVPDGRVETIIDAVIEGRAVWGSVREALAILLGGNLGEIGFNLIGTAVSGRTPLTARQLLVVNLLTDVLPSVAIAVRPPGARTPEALLAEGPEASLGRSLERTIAVRATTTALAATGGWLVARATGPPARASTVALASLVGAQLGQTLVAGGRNPAVVLATLGSTAALVGLIQTPGVSQLVGCTPLDPIGWGIAASASAAAAVAAAAGPLVASLAKAG